jgi:hypothetical protein
MCITGAIALFAVLFVTAAQSTVFPDRVPRYMWPIAAHSIGTSKATAIANLSGPRQRAAGFFQTNGFPAGVTVVGPPLAFMSGIPSDMRWTASQDIAVPAETYARFARLSNRLEIYQRGRDDLTWSFPEPPFATFAKVIGVLTILLLCLSVVSLETRSADVSRAPRGMHPASVALQTMTCGLLILISLVEAHVLALLGPRVLAFVLAVGIVSIGAWLFKTRAWWNDNAFLRRALLWYVAAFVAIIAFGGYALTVPVT